MFKINKSAIIVLVIISISLLVRLYFCFKSGTNSLKWPDEMDYITLSDNLEENGEFYINALGGHKFYSFRAPGYVFFLFVVRKITRSIFFIKIVQILISCLSLYLIFKISLKLYKARTIPYLAVLMASLYPLSIYYSAMILSETVVIFLLLTILNILLNTYQKNKPASLHAFIFGILSGYLILIKPEYVILMFFCLFFFDIKKIILIILGSIIIISPWIYRNYRVHNSLFWISTNSGYMFWLGNRHDAIQSKFSHPTDNSQNLSDMVLENQRFDEVKLQKEFFKRTLQNDIKNAKDILKLTFHKFINMWVLPIYTTTRNEDTNVFYLTVGSICYYLIILFGIIGSFWKHTGISKEVKLVKRFAFYLFMTVLINGIIFLPRARYRYPFEYILILFAAAGIYQIWIASYKFCKKYINGRC